MTKGDHIVMRFLEAWVPYDAKLSKFREVLHYLDADRHGEARTRVYQAITAYLLTERQQVLNDWALSQGRELNAADVEILNPVQQRMMHLNAISGFYGADRVIIHLALHAHLLGVTEGLDEVNDQMDTLVAELYQG
jgi:hypothetical protein